MSAIAVLLPARDAGATLGRALESLHAQTERPERVIVVDDGSIDATPVVIAEWARRWEAIEARRTAGVGVAAALNTGLAAIFERGDCSYVARMDADDIADPRRFARQRELASRDDLALVGCEVVHAGGEDCAGMRRHVAWANALHSHDELAQGLWIDSPLPHPTWLARRDVFEAIGAYTSEPLPEDYDWLHRFFRAGLRAGKVPGEPLLEWTDSPSRLTRNAAEYTERAFNRVKGAALAECAAIRGRDVFLFGLGPKGKALFPVVRSAAGGIRAIVDVHPRRVGERYHGVPIIDPAAFRAVAESAFVIIAVGTAEARAECEAECRALGLFKGADYLAL